MALMPVQCYVFYNDASEQCSMEYMLECVQLCCNQPLCEYFYLISMCKQITEFILP